jgi:GTPase SAR1 family protein
MTIQLLDANARLSEARGPKILICGPTSVGKTSLLKTLSPELLSTTLLVDLEAGDLPVADLPVASTRPRTSPGLRDLACAVGGPSRAHVTGAYSPSHHESVVADPAFASLARFNIVFVDSYTELSRRCRTWCEAQPESFNAYGKRDSRSVYNLLAKEMISLAQAFQHARPRTVVLTAILERITDDYGVQVGESNWKASEQGASFRRSST